MGAYIARQPNGLLCRFSSSVDAVTHYNYSEEEYIELCAERAREEDVAICKTRTSSSRLTAWWMMSALTISLTRNG